MDFSDDAYARAVLRLLPVGCPGKLEPGRMLALWLQAPPAGIRWGGKRRPRAGSLAAPCCSGLLDPLRQPCLDRAA